MLGGGNPVGGSNPTGISSNINYIGNHVYGTSGAITATNGSNGLINSTSTSTYIPPYCSKMT